MGARLPSSVTLVMIKEMLKLVLKCDLSLYRFAMGIAKDHIFKPVLTFSFIRANLTDEESRAPERFYHMLLPFTFLSPEAEICYVFNVGLSYSLQF